MTKEVKCRACGKVMFTLALLPDGKHWALEPRQKYIKKGNIIICPHCNAEHSTDSLKDSSGLSQTEITGLIG